MKASDIQREVERPDQARQFNNVQAAEIHRYGCLAGFLPGAPYCEPGEIDAHHRPSSPRHPNRIRPGAAAEIERPAGRRAVDVLKQLRW
jgi:hypothetical protein